MKKFLITVIATLATSSALAATSYQGYITKTGTRGDGTVFIEISTAIGPAGCTFAQIEIPANSPAAKQIFAVALAAYLQHSQVYIQTDACHGSFPTLSGNGSWIYPMSL